jgi:restriction system protein
MKNEEIKLAVFSNFKDCIRCERAIFNNNFPGGQKNVTQHYDNVKVLSEKKLFSIIYDSKYEKEFNDLKPTEIITVSIDDFRKWTPITIEEAEKLRRFTYDQIVQTCHDELIKAISDNPSILDEVEWRELERIVFFSLQGLGFDCELTPSSKDGGKDVIVRVQVRGVIDIYYVEIKHWKQKVGKSEVKHFLEVIIKDEAYKGLFLATSGYTSAAIKIVNELKEQRIILDDGDKIVTICQLYSKLDDGIIINYNTLYNQIFYNK